MAESSAKAIIKTNNYTIKKVYLKFLKLCAMGVLASTVGVVCDSFIAGNYISENAISAISLSNPVYLLSTMVFMIFSLGGATVSSQFAGQGSFDKTSLIYTISMKIGLLVSCILGAVIFLFRVPIIQAFGAADPEVIAMASDYIIGLCISMPFVLIFNASMSFIGLDGSPQIGFLATVVMAVSKIALDILFCAGLRFGIMAVSLTTGISALLGYLVCRLHFRKKYCTLKFVPLQGNLNLLDLILITGFPNAVTFLWNAIRGIITNHVLVSAGGLNAVAASGVSDNISSLLTVVVMSFGYAMTSFLGLFYGEKDKRSMHDVFAVALKMGLISSAVCSVLIFASSSFLPHVFGLKDATALAYATSAIRFLASYFIAIGFFYLFMYTYQSTRHTLLANYVVLAKTLLFFVPILFLLSSALGVTGIWMAQSVSDWLALISLLIMILIRTRKLSINSLLLLPKDFDDITLYADVSVYYTQHSLQIFSDTLIHRVSKEIHDRTILAARNVIAQGPETDRKTFDIRIAEIDGKTTIRMRYCGVPFNAAADISGTRYQYSLGFNTIVIPIAVAQE